jgi:evolutionarily conserved signaling intermediate in Toll pathway
MCYSADPSTKIELTYTNEDELSSKKSWILSAQSPKQQEILFKHNKSIPMFVEGPNYTWLKSKMIKYFVLKTDPLEETAITLKKIKEYDDYDLKNFYNMFEDPSNNKTLVNKKPELSVHETIEGNIYAVCCTETSTKESVYNWTKFLEEKNQFLKDFLIVFRMKTTPSYLVNLKNDNDQEKK